LFNACFIVQSGEPEGGRADNQTGYRPETTAPVHPGHFAVSGLHCFQEDGFGQASATSDAYEPKETAL
jgi:hypothetical protein